jgi:hypothetical protein
MPAASARVVHFAYDTLPRVLTPGQPNPERVDLRMPFRIESFPSEQLRVVSWRFLVQVDGRPWTVPSSARRITREVVDLLRRQVSDRGQFHFDRVPPYLDMADRMEPGVQYLEGSVPGVPRGARVDYRLEVTLGRDLQPAFTISSRSYSTYATCPVFGRDDITRIHIPEPGRALAAWALYRRREPGFEHVRLDVVSLEADPEARSARPDLADLVLVLGGRTIDLRNPELPVLPLVDTAADAVTISVPEADGPAGAVTVRYRGAPEVTVPPEAPVHAGRTRVMFVNFAIQGLNDYFATATPPTAHDPVPHTYTQVTMRDEGARFSSRPGSMEDSTGDGYAFTLQAHRRYRIKQMWAMNGGLLDLLAHDCPDELAQMHDDMAAGLLEPVVAGFGAHRLPYYRTDTNNDAITAGAEAMANLLGAAPELVYYPDSRIVTGTPNVADALRRAQVRYLVVDAGESKDGQQLPDTRLANVVPPLNAESEGRWVNWQYLWRDRISGTKVLFIDPEMKDGLFEASDREADRGKVSLGIRRKFIELAAQPALRRDNLLVYSDDADKASGNGWFDGVYNGGAVQFNRKYQAALSWIAAHPWVQPVTTADLTDADCVGELDLLAASDPYIRKEWDFGVPPAPGHDNHLAYDGWYVRWADLRAAWLGETLRAVSDRAERTLAQRPATNQLDELARLYLTMCLHESQWSKRARDTQSSEAEDFVIAESLQLRNTHVYLNAAIWADWAQTPDAAGQAFRDRGPVIEAVAELDETVDADGRPPWWRASAAGLQWDHDPLPNVILYNDRALVVVDRNGGRITHLFALVDGRPVSLSGTFKAYQFLDVEWASEAGVKADGIVLQNTVYTPNHAYVACDVEAGQGTIGAGPPDEVIFDWYYPDNFNAYQVADEPADDPHDGCPSVTLVYGPGTAIEDTPDTLPDLDEALAADLTAKVAGEPGIVLHDVSRFGEFRKSIQLDGRTVRVRYQGTRPGHRVANEFCVDLHAAALQGRRQAAEVGPDGRTATVRQAETPFNWEQQPARSPARLEVEVRLGAGCAFSATTCTPLEPPTVEKLRLHRVMTDNVEIVAPDGGEFDYEIELP